MKNVKLLVLLLIIILMTGCKKEEISIKDEVLREQEKRDMKISADLIDFEDFQLVEDLEWLIPLESYGEEVEDKSLIREEEFLQLQKELLKRMDKDLNIEHMHMIHSDNDFLIFWNSKLGKIYLYDDEKHSLQFLLDTAIPNKRIEEAGPPSLFFYEDFLLRYNSNEERVYFIGEEELLAFDHEGGQVLNIDLGHGFIIDRLLKDFAVFIKEGKTYLYSHDKESISHVFHRDIIDYYKSYIIFQEASKIYVLDPYNNKIYFHEEEDIAEMKTMVFIGTDKIYFIDEEDIDSGPRSYRIKLPEI